MPVLPLSAIAELVAGRPALAGRTHVIAVDGPSGSGKTTLGARLAPIAGAAVIHMDDFYPGWDGLAEAPGLLVDGVLAPLAAGTPASYRQWDWDTHRWAEVHPVPAAPIVIVEGVGSGAPACAPYLSLLLWVGAPRNVRFARGLARDGEAYRPYWQRWAAQEAEMFASDNTRERADVLVDGDPRVDHDPATQFVTFGH